MKFEIRIVLAASVLAVGTGILTASEPSPQTDEAVLNAQQTRIAAAAKAIPTVLAIFSPGGQGGGSGVVISLDGYALTNFHVARPCGTFMKCGMADGKLYDAVIVGLDPVGDVGLIKLYGRNDFPAAELADSDEVQVGDWCFAMGNPFLLATDFHPTVSYGVVSGVHRYQYPAGTLLEYTDCLQVDAAINPGNSGGPLFDSQGRLIGINGRGSFEKRGRVNVGVGYSISINQIKNFLGDLKSGRILDHATLGAQTATSDNGRVLVSDILENSDAFRRGLRYDDEIISFAGRPVHSVNAFKNILGIFPKGWRVALTYRRDGKSYDTSVRLMGVHTESELLAKIEGQKEIEPPQPNPRQPGRRPNAPGQPKPGETPKPGERGEDLDKAVKNPIPDDLKKQYEARQGYANYYFNRQNTERVWQKLIGRSDFSQATGDWRISGRQLAGTMMGQPMRGLVSGIATTGASSEKKQLPGKPPSSGDITIQLSDDECTIDLPTGSSKISADDGIDSVLNPPGSGGLLPALYLWRKMLIGGPSKYGQVTYEGTAPLPGREGFCDVLVAIGEGIETFFYCDPADGSLVAIEMYPDDGVDPCEVYFTDYHEVEGRQLPQRMEVHYGDTMFGVFALTSYDLQKPVEESP